MTSPMMNLNGNLLCSIDCETTGTKPGYHDIIQLAIIPVNNYLKPDSSRLPFIIDMIPKRPDHIDHEALRINRRRMCEIMQHGIDPYSAQDLFIDWFDKQKLGTFRTLMPLACNWPFDSSFIRDWLGPETFHLYFNPIYRDTMVMATLINDKAGFCYNDFPIPKVSLGYLCSYLHIERTAKHDAVDDARVTIEVYRKLLQEYMR